MGFASVWNRGEGTLWLGRTFFVWVSVFNLFAVSVFWSFLADTFRDDQAKRWFGVIAAGGTLGGIGGSLLAGRLAGWMGMTNLLLLPVPLLIGCVACMFGLHFSALRFRARSGFRGESAAPGLGGRDKDVTQADEPPPEERPTGGSFWEGMWHVVASPYLLAICAMLLAVKVCGTIGYYQQNELIGEAIARPETRLQLFADINLAVQVITIVLQALVAGQVMQRLGLSVALIALPIAYLISFTALAVTATVSVLVAARVAQRSVGFGLFVPAQETLFTVVPRRDKYKAKGFMDTALSRGADVAAGWAYNGLRGLGLTLAQIALLAVPMTLVWALLGWLLGKAFRRRAAMGGGPLD